MELEKKFRKMRQDFQLNCRFKGIFTPYGDKRLASILSQLLPNLCQDLDLKILMKKNLEVIFFRPFHDERVPQNVQNLVIRDFCKKNF